MKRILIIEDDPTLLRGLKDNFAAEGYAVDTAHDGITGLEKALTASADLIILDIMLPGLNGYELCRNLRMEKIDTPVLMLTAKTEESDVLLGLGIGADDYVTKPFRIRELLARAATILRRTSPATTPDSETIHFANLTLDTRAHELRNADKTLIDLSPKEYDLLALLASHPGRAFDRQEIMQEVWGWDAQVTLRSIDRFVTSIRKKIEPDPQYPVLLLTVRGYGYRFASREET